MQCVDLDVSATFHSACVCVLQLSPGSSASLEVVAQLGHWGHFPLLRCFVSDLRAVLAAQGSPSPPDFARQVAEWRGVARKASWVSHS